MEGETGIVEGHTFACVCVYSLTYGWGGRDQLSVWSKIWEVCVCGVCVCVKEEMQCGSECVCVWREWFVCLCVETRLCLCFCACGQIWGVCVGRDVCVFARVYGWVDRFVCVWGDTVCVEGELGCVTGGRPGDVCVEGEIGVCVSVCVCWRDWRLCLWRLGCLCGCGGGDGCMCVEKVCE